VGRLRDAVSHATIKLERVLENISPVRWVTKIADRIKRSVLIAPSCVIVQKSEIGKHVPFTQRPIVERSIRLNSRPFPEKDRDLLILYCTRHGPIHFNSFLSFLYCFPVLPVLVLARARKTSSQFRGSQSVYLPSLLSRHL